MKNDLAAHFQRPQRNEEAMRKLRAHPRVMAANFQTYYFGDLETAQLPWRNGGRITGFVVLRVLADTRVYTATSYCSEGENFDQYIGMEIAIKRFLRAHPEFR